MPYSVYSAAAPAAAATRQPQPLDFVTWRYQNPWASRSSQYSSVNTQGEYQNYLNQFNANQGSPAGGGSNPPYSTNPRPQSGVPNPFGAVPGPVGLPNRFADLAQVFPNLSATNAQVSGVLNDQLAGRVPNADVSFLQDREAAAAQAGGMPGSNVRGESLYGHRTARDYGMLEMARQQQGLGNYANIINAISGTQTVSPETQIGLGDRNAYYAAAPNPAAANTYAQGLYNRYLQDLYGRGGGYQRPGPQEGSGSYAMPTPSSGGTPAPSPVIPSPSGGTGSYSTGTLGPNSYTTQGGDVYGLPENWNSLGPNAGTGYTNQNLYMQGLDAASAWLRAHPEDYGGGAFGSDEFGGNFNTDNYDDVMAVWDDAPPNITGYNLNDWGQYV